MPEMILDAFMAQLMSSARMTSENVIELRKNVFSDGVMTRGEAQMLLDLDRAATDKCAEWAPFLYEAISDYIVHQERPSGYISQDNAVWLQNTLAKDSTQTIVGLLVHVLEKAKSAPESLATMGLNAVAKNVVANDGDVPHVSKSDVSMLRRILYAFGGLGNAGLSRAEVEVLFDLNDQTVAAYNDPEWNDFFTKAIASYVLSFSGYVAPSREEALRQEVFVNDPSVNLSSFFSRMVSGGLSAIADSYSIPDGLEAAYAAKNAAFDAAQADAEIVDEEEAKWVAERIGRDRIMHENERMLLKFLKQESSNIHPALQPLLDKVA